MLTLIELDTLVASNPLPGNVACTLFRVNPTVISYFLSQII
jgi:hypothetical protein